MRDSGFLEFASGGLWTARDFARAAREMQDQHLRADAVALEIYSQAVGDTVFHVLGDYGLVQKKEAMRMIVQRHQTLGLL